MDPTTDQVEKVRDSELTTIRSEVNQERILE